MLFELKRTTFTLKETSFYFRNSSFEIFFFETFSKFLFFLKELLNVKDFINYINSILNFFLVSLDFLLSFFLKIFFNSENRIKFFSSKFINIKNVFFFKNKTFLQWLDDIFFHKEKNNLECFFLKINNFILDEKSFIKFEEILFVFNSILKKFNLILNLNFLERLMYILQNKKIITLLFDVFVLKAQVKNSLIIILKNFCIYFKNDFTKKLLDYLYLFSFSKFDFSFVLFVDLKDFFLFLKSFVKKHKLLLILLEPYKKYFLFFEKIEKLTNKDIRKIFKFLESFEIDFKGSIIEIRSSKKIISYVESSNLEINLKKTLINLINLRTINIKKIYEILQCFENNSLKKGNLYSFLKENFNLEIKNKIFEEKASNINNNFNLLFSVFFLFNLLIEKFDFLKERFGNFFQKILEDFSNSSSIFEVLEKKKHDIINFSLEKKNLIIDLLNKNNFLFLRFFRIKGLLKFLRETPNKHLVFFLEQNFRNFLLEKKQIFINKKFLKMLFGKNFEIEEKKLNPYKIWFLFNFGMLNDFVKFFDLKEENITYFFSNMGIRISQELSMDISKRPIINPLLHVISTIFSRSEIKIEEIGSINNSLEIKKLLKNFSYALKNRTYKLKIVDSVGNVYFFHFAFIIYLIYLVIIKKLSKIYEIIIHLMEILKQQEKMILNFPENLLENRLIRKLFILIEDFFSTIFCFLFFFETIQKEEAMNFF